MCFFAKNDNLILRRKAKENNLKANHSRFDEHEVPRPSLDSEYPSRVRRSHNGSLYPNGKSAAKTRFPRHFPRLAASQSIIPRLQDQNWGWRKTVPVARSTLSTDISTGEAWKWRASSHHRCQILLCSKSRWFSILKKFSKNFVRIL